MASAVNALVTNVTAASLWGAFEGVIPFLAVIIPVSLGLFFLRKLIKGAGNNGKVRT